MHDQRGHFRAAGKLPLATMASFPRASGGAAPKMDEVQLTAGATTPFSEKWGSHRNAGLLALHGQSGTRRRRNHCGFYFTRNFPNRLGKGANVYLASAELAAVSSILGKLPTPENLEWAGKLAGDRDALIGI